MARLQKILFHFSANLKHKLNTLRGRVITKNQRQKTCCLYLEAVLLYLLLEYLQALGEICEVLIHGLN